MSQIQLVKLTGVIKKLHRHYWAGSPDVAEVVEFTFLDQEKRLLLIRYCFPRIQTAEVFQQSLSEGMRAEIQIRGPVTPADHTYYGVGSITVHD
jgi:hypothetical protein